MDDYNNDTFTRSRTFLILCFVIFYLISIIILTFMWKFKNSQEVINQFSIGSAISSILLAIMAITYAFMESRKSSLQNLYTQDVLSKINEKVTQFSEIRDEIYNFRYEFASTNRNYDELSNAVITKLEGIEEIAVAGASKISEEQNAGNNIQNILNNELLRLMNKNSEIHFGQSILVGDKVINRFMVSISLSPNSRVDIQNYIKEQLTPVSHNLYQGLDLLKVDFDYFTNFNREHENQLTMLVEYLHPNIVLRTSVEYIFNNIQDNLFTLNNVERI